MIPSSPPQPSTDQSPDQAIDFVHDHLSEARQRARDVLSGESHLGSVDDWRQAVVTARDTIMLTWLIWVAMRGLDVTADAGAILVAAGLGIAFYLGIAAAVATRVHLRYLEQELERERCEIRDNPEHEREEVRALYAAKGFSDPLLTEVTDILCADDDRLLKLMMEEELGLFIHHVNHPLLVGLWNGAGAAAGALLLAVPVCFQHPDITLGWMPAGTCTLLLAIAAFNAYSTRRSLFPLWALWLAIAAMTGGATYYLAAIIGGRT